MCWEQSTVTIRVSSLLFHSDNNYNDHVSAFRLDTKILQHSGNHSICNFVFGIQFWKFIPTIYANHWTTMLNHHSIFLISQFSSIFQRNYDGNQKIDCGSVDCCYSLNACLLSVSNHHLYGEQWKGRLGL